MGSERRPRTGSARVSGLFRGQPHSVKISRGTPTGLFDPAHRPVHHGAATVNLAPKRFL
jgi:hypothetical protein